MSMASRRNRADDDVFREKIAVDFFDTIVDYIMYLLNQEERVQIELLG